MLLCLGGVYIGVLASSTSASDPGARFRIFWREMFDGLLRNSFVTQFIFFFKLLSHELDIFTLCDCELIKMASFKRPLSAHDGFSLFAPIPPLLFALRHVHGTGMCAVIIQ